MKRVVFALLISCVNIFCFGQQSATVKEYNKIFTTYPFSDPNPIPLLSPVYPYFRYDGFTDKPVQKEWKVVELENDYIKVMILPEIGGKIWSATEKKTGKEFLYYNHVIKFRDVAMRGPWTSGGLEANFGIIGHTPNCATPVDYITRTNDDGSVSCIIGVLDLLTRSNWRMEIKLEKDKAYFTTQVFWYNTTATEQPYYHWMNAGIKAAGNLEFIYPGTKYIGHEGEYSDWPINKDNGKKINWYEENNFGTYKSYHVFGKYTDFFGAYWHNDDYGMARYGTHDDKAGKKIWIWGLSRQGMIWDKLLSDTDGQYVEVQSGRLFNQNAPGSSFTPFKHLSFAPYATDTWKEYWYPVMHTKGFVEANNYGALNLKYENGWLKVYFSPVQQIDDVIEVKENDKVLYSKRLQLKPLQVFADSIKVNANANELVATLGKNKMWYETDSAFNVLNRPVETPKDFDWSSAYGLYVQGEELIDQKFYADAEDKLNESLQKDANYLPALIKMSELLYRNMRYKEALSFATKALSIDNEAGDANYYYGLINEALDNITDAKDGFDIASLSPAYRSAAYTELSKLYTKEKNFDKALNYAQRAVDYNKYDIAALQIMAVAYRYQNNDAKAKEVLATILTFDPLNHFARFEKYLWQQNDESKQQFQSLIRNELPAETYDELGVWYYNAGCKDEALKVFSLSPASAEAEYWKAFLNNTTVDFSKISPTLSFPFRSETGKVIEQLLTKQNDWLLKYHLALIYKDRNRIEECKKLLNSCSNEPNFAPFYAVRAAIFKDYSIQALADLQKAISLDSQWRYNKLLGEYYIEHKQYEKALAVAEAYYKRDPANYIIEMLYAKTLLLNKKYKEVDALLSKMNIIPFEGATDGRELYHEAKLMLAVEQMKNKQYKKALVFINDAKLWPENLGVGKPYDEDIDIRLEDWMQYLCYSKMKQKDTTVLLQKIVAFKPMINNTIRNFLPANALVSAWAYDKMGMHDKANEWLGEQIAAFPNNKLLLWSKDQFNNKNLIEVPNNETARILAQLILLEKEK
jgi:tetratricopeptide (TPR) repeat protein